MHIDRISRHYAKRIEESVFVKELEELSHEMIRKYCFLVRNHSLLQYSRVVRDALNYIDSHLKESISLKGLRKSAMSVPAISPPVLRRKWDSPWWIISTRSGCLRLCAIWRRQIFLWHRLPSG